MEFISRFIRYDDRNLRKIADFSFLNIPLEMIAYGQDDKERPFYVVNDPEPVIGFFPPSVSDMYSKVTVTVYTSALIPLCIFKEILYRYHCSVSLEYHDTKSNDKGLVGFGFSSVPERNTEIHTTYGPEVYWDEE
jgi:hypothetical protein